MTSELARLAQRRNALTARIASERTEFARATGRWRTPLAHADLGVAAFQFVARHKIAIAGALGLIALWKPRWALRTARGGWLLWRIALRIARSWGG